jgi:hypothetical protein
MLMEEFHMFNFSELKDEAWVTDLIFEIWYLVLDYCGKAKRDRM